jgi:hypothetical protein
MATRDNINKMLDETRRCLLKVNQIGSVKDALKTLDAAQQWINDPHTIVKNEYDPLLDKKPIETFTNDELIAEIRNRMFCGAAKA